MLQRISIPVRESVSESVSKPAKKSPASAGDFQIPFNFFRLEGSSNIPLRFE